jgi:purine-binding chemotaxis protein CheW
MLPSSSTPAAASGAATDVAPVSRGGKFLTFYLADEEYGVEILKVQEIIGMQPITRVPRTPAFLRGVINLRGKVIPVVDLRERFGMPPAVTDAVTEADAAAVATAAALRCIIVVQVRLATAGADDAPAARPVPMGIVVDRVSEVAAIADADVEDAPSFGAGVRTEYLLGLGKTGTADGHGRVKLLLDIDRVLATDELAELPRVAAEAE